MCSGAAEWSSQDCSFIWFSVIEIALAPSEVSPVLSEQLAGLEPLTLVVRPGPH